MAVRIAMKILSLLVGKKNLTQLNANLGDF